MNGTCSMVFVCVVGCDCLLVCLLCCNYVMLWNILLTCCVVDNCNESVVSCCILWNDAK